MFPKPIPSLNIGGRLLSLAQPQVMGILNLTPDSFYAPSRQQTAEEIRHRARQIVDEGGTMIDVGACSSRPGASETDIAEEMHRLREGIPIIKEAAPDAMLSVDTWRAEVAQMCVEELGIDMVNDISGGQMDKHMLETVARLKVPYILMHMKGTPLTMQNETDYGDIVSEMMLYFSERINRLHELGVADIMLDPGFGFAKTTEQNYQIMDRLEDFQELGLPLLVGVSRKSMICRVLDCTNDEALNGTTALHAIALGKGASILRVHDVKAAAETIKIFLTLQAQREETHLS